MEAIELRNKTDILQNEVKLLIEQFIKEVGECNINIKVSNRTFEAPLIKKHYVDTDVEINVTV